MQRRSLIKVGFASASVLVVAGGGFALLAPPFVQGRLSPGAREMFAAVAESVLQGLLPTANEARRIALQEHLARLELTIAGFPPALQAEVAQLVSLLVHAPGRIALTGLTSPWNTASPAEVHAALQGLRVSSLALRQQAFHALRDLSNAAYFSDSAAWAVLAYPGPQRI
jgi:hypothetical protein